MAETQSGAPKTSLFFSDFTFPSLAAAAAAGKASAFTNRRVGSLFSTGDASERLSP